MLPSDTKATTKEPSATLLIYDGGCPFCHRYLRYLRLKATIPELELVDARLTDTTDLIPCQFHLDDGMLLKIEENWFHGADAIHRIALLSSRTNWFNRMNYRIFRSPRLAAALYPVLRFLRNLTLNLLLRDQLGKNR